MCNTDIREAIKKAGLRQWMIADKMGMSETTFCRILRKELSEEQKKEILEVVLRSADRERSCLNSERRFN